MKCWKTGEEFKDLLLKDNRCKNIINPNDLKGLFSFEKSLKNIDFIYRKVGIK